MIHTVKNLHKVSGFYLLEVANRFLPVAEHMAIVRAEQWMDSIMGPGIEKGLASSFEKVKQVGKEVEKQADRLEKEFCQFDDQLSELMREIEKSEEVTHNLELLWKSEETILGSLELVDSLEHLTNEVKDFIRRQSDKSRERLETFEELREGCLSRKELEAARERAEESRRRIERLLSEKKMAYTMVDGIMSLTDVYEDAARNMLALGYLFALWFNFGELINIEFNSDGLVKVCVDAESLALIKQQVEKSP